MGNIESVDGQSEMKHHIMPLKVPMPDPTELEEKFAIVLVSCEHLSMSYVVQMSEIIFNCNYVCLQSCSLGKLQNSNSK